MLYISSELKLLYKFLKDISALVLYRGKTSDSFNNTLSVRVLHFCID